LAVVFDLLFLSGFSLKKSETPVSVDLSFAFKLNFDFNLFAAEVEEKIYYVSKEDGL
jgi:hypothetical protein